MKALSKPHWSFLASLGLASLALVGCERPLVPAVQTSKTTVVALRSELGGDQAAGGASAVAAAEPTGFGTIRGKFKLSGPAPAMPNLNIDKDREVCMPGGKPVASNALVVDQATGGIENIVIYLFNKIPLDDEKWIHSSYADTATGTRDFDQKLCMFLSPMFAMRTTQRMKILNSDPIGHNTNITPKGKTSPFNQTLAANSFVMYEPGGESPEPFSVSCTIHPWMSARMLVRDSPYFAVSGKTGEFEIANIPAGVNLDFKVWQELAGFIQDVNVNGAATQWKRGKFSLTLKPDEEVNMEVTIDPSVFSK